MGAALRHPSTDPFETGHIDVAGGHRLWWERVGTPGAKPAVVLHGGPGSGVSEWWRGFFDPDRYCVTLFDQRGCGRSRPLASDDALDWSTITTGHLVADVEALREQAGVDSWLVFGGSWGSTLALAYAVEHPRRVDELVLWGVTTTTRHEVNWLTWTMGEVYPEAFAELVSLIPDVAHGESVPAAYFRLLTGPDTELRASAASAWCRWEDRVATLSGDPQPSRRFADPQFRLGFSRLVTHLFEHHASTESTTLEEGLEGLADVPAVLVRGRLDIASPLGVAWRLAQALPRAELTVVESDGHGGDATTNDVLVRTLDAMATRDADPWRSR